MQQELINNGANFADIIKHLPQEEAVTIINSDSDTIETTRGFNLKAARKILELVNKNEHKELKSLLEGAQLNTKFSPIINAREDKSFYNFLIWAAYFNFPEITEVLCEAGISVNYARPCKQITALHMACEKRSLECVKILLKYGADINAKTSEGQTPLYIASYYGYDEIVQYLCSEKADTTIFNINRFNPLHMAVKKNKIKCVEMLIDYFPDLEIEGKSKLTPLFLAINNQHENLVEYLLGKKLILITVATKILHLCIWQPI